MAYINDFSGNGNHLTNTNSLLSQISLAPIAVLNGTGHLKVANNASLSIAGDESYLQSTLRGLTFGGWFYMTSIPASVYLGAAPLYIGADDDGAAASRLFGYASLCFLCASALPDATIRA